MGAIKLNRFLMVDFTGWNSNIGRENHLGAILQKCPQKASDMVVQLLALHRGASLESELAKYDTKYFDTDDDFVWDVLGNNRRNITLIEARTETGAAVGTDNVGVGGAPFYLVFSEDWFNDGETLYGNLNEEYPMRVLGHSYQEGTNFVYKVQLMGCPNGIPAERLQAGELFSHSAAYVSREYSRMKGGVRQATNVTMRNEWSVIRKSYKMPGSSALNKKLAFGIPVVDKNGNSHVENMWIHKVEWEFEQEWSDEKAEAMMFGKSTRNANGEYTAFDSNGEPIKVGDGILEQMKYGNTYYYNDFSLKLLEDVLYELSASKLDVKDRTFIIRTGMEGARKFHYAVRNAMSGWTEFQVNADALGVVRKSASTINGGNPTLAAGYQFTEFSAPNGITVKLEVDNWYDDRVRNKVLDADGKPLMSSRFDIMAIGTTEQPNIFKCALRNNAEYTGYQSGPFANPWTGETNINYAATDEDMAVIHKKATLGVCILDPTRTLSLIPQQLVG